MIKNRLLIKENGDSTKFFCKKCNLPIANGYLRVVTGERGPYIEFGYSNIIHENKSFVEDQRHIYFVEYCSNCKDKVFIYFQKKTVAYADYLIGKFYIDPKFLVTENGSMCIEPEESIKPIELF